MPGSGRGQDVVVDAVADVRDLAGAAAHQRRRPARRTRAPACATPRLADDEITSAGSADSRAHASSASVWLPATPTRKPSVAQPLEARRARRGTDRRARTGLVDQPVGCSTPSWPQSAVVLLAARDRHAERGPDDMRLQAPLRRRAGATTAPRRRASRRRRRRRAFRATTRRAPRSAGVVTFSSRGSPSTTATRPPPRSTSDAQSVAPSRSPANAAPERRREERLRRLGRDETVAVDGLHDDAVANALERVGDRERRDRAVEALAERRRAARSTTASSTSGRAASWTSTTSASSGTSASAARDRLRARRASRDAGDDLRGRELLGEEDRRLLPARRRRDDDRVDELAPVEPVEALREQRPPAEGGERLRTVDPEPLARAGGGDERPGGPDLAEPPRAPLRARGCGLRLRSSTSASAAPARESTSSSHAAASSSSMSFAYMSSEARIFFALTNICFSPVERPFSLLRTARFRTTSASSKMSRSSSCRGCA